MCRTQEAERVLARLLAPTLTRPGSEQSDPRAAAVADDASLGQVSKQKARLLLGMLVCDLGQYLSTRAFVSLRIAAALLAADSHPRATLPWACVTRACPKEPQGGQPRSGYGGYGDVLLVKGGQLPTSDDGDGPSRA
ncbi:hypothetical protein K458DRAFT_428648 [Lentithecium fluviatile CBS 122367]|uniref:Uncharacterized protein n=1 Tax=Lentithecium fluviatile CBS 122367 TaxID=1168545 RepID=A0A6G1JCG4_9PLEO|nr:hypothetical protein K458DRAFT_428648 [Lentithecium fluviatile CBS 122367]